MDAKAESWRGISGWKETGLENVSFRNQTSYCSQHQPPNFYFPNFKKSSDSIFFSFAHDLIHHPTQFPQSVPSSEYIFSHLVHQLNVIITLMKVFNRYNGLRVEKIGCV